MFVVMIHANLAPMVTVYNIIKVYFIRFRNYETYKEVDLFCGFECGKHPGIFCGRMSVPQNNVMDMCNVTEFVLD